MKFLKELNDPIDRCVIFMLSYCWLIIMAGMVLSFLKGTRMGIDAVAEMAFPFP
jgi:hypothetical protein